MKFYILSSLLVALISGADSSTYVPKPIEYPYECESSHNCPGTWSCADVSITIDGKQCALQDGEDVCQGKVCVETSNCPTG